MTKNAFAILLFFLISGAISGQVLRGKITNPDGNPVPFATVYISELKHGTTANIKGEYQINLKQGSYTLFFQSLGFAPEIKKISVLNEDIHLDIILNNQYYEIPEVRVTSSGEDPAYAIMRKAIGFAPYYLNQIKHYRAEIYIKGSVIVKNIPKIMQRSISVNDEQIKEGEVYLIESINEIEFNAPDKYEQRVISQHSTFPESGAGSDISPMDIVNASFYEPLMADIAVSPLAPNAMSYYRYRYEGSTLQGNYVVNKISVIPKRKSQQVFEGTIYIIEDFWCIHSIDLINENLAGSISIKQVYTPVEEEIWMPVSHNFEVKISVVGVKADGEYGSAVTYSVVEPNRDLERPSSLPSLAINSSIEQEITESPVSQEKAKIDELLRKDELSNRDMVKLSRLMEKEAEKLDPDSEELEIKRTTNFIVEEDADKRDTTYWNSVRPIPLSELEAKSIRVNDSIFNRSTLAKSEASQDTLPGKAVSRGSGKIASSVLFGKTFNSDSNNLSFRYGGLINPDRYTFNTVDGLRYGTDFRLTNRWDNGLRLTITPSLEWAFARERLIWRVNTTLTYNKMKQSRLLIWAGRSSQDYNRSAGISPSLNMFTTLLFRENYLKLYENNFFTIGHRQELVNGLYAEVRYNYEERRTLNNSSDFSLFRKGETFTPNIPYNSYLPDPPDINARYNISSHLHYDVSLVVTYTPRQKYYLNEGVKSPAGSSYPTFILSWKHGINENPGNISRSFDLVKAEASKSRSIGAFSEYGWSVAAGGFINNEGVEYPDFIHFNSQPLPVLLTNYRNVFMLPGYYSLATPDYFAEVHFRFTTPYLLVKLIPFLSNTLMRENISIAWLYTPHTRNYYELGYALSEVLLLGRIGVYTGFENLTWKGAGIRFTFIFD